MIRNLFAILLVVLLNLVFAQRSNQAQQCLLNNRQTGSCRLISECRSLSRGAQPILCGNSRFGPIVCCPAQGGRHGGANRRIGGPASGAPNHRRLHGGPTTAGPGFSFRNNGNPFLSPYFRNNPDFTFPTDSGTNPWLPQNPERIQTQSGISQAKCQQYYPSNRVKRQDFMITVVGGSPTTPGEFPFMAALGWESTAGGYDYNCGGSLISENFVVTAAHCASARGRAPNVVRLGGDSLATEGVQVRVSSVLVHPSYRVDQVYNDIALVRLESSVRLKPACLWPTGNINQQAGIAIGYGHTSFGGRRSDDLLKVTLNIFGNQQCSRYYQPGPQIPNGIQNTQLCAGDPNNKMDTCHGDSGGPIVVRSGGVPYLIGVTSFGQGCAGTAPSIYTRISSYIPWIESIVWSNQRGR